jgi:hypothetical protein
MMMIGTMHHSNVIHIGRHVKTTKDGHKLYEPACASMRLANVTYLGVQLGHLEAVTCKRCQKKAADYPSRFQA